MSPITRMSPDDDRQADVRLRRRATLAALAVVSALIVIKAGAFLASGSVAILGSLIDSLLDLVGSAMNFIAVRQAMVPADHDHRFGHGKAEALAGMGRSLLVLGSAGFLAVEAVNRLIDPVEIRNSGPVMIVLAVSAVLSGGLALYQKRIYRRTQSLAIGADATNYGADAAVSLGAVGVVWLASAPGFAIADPLFGFAIAVAIALSSWMIVMRAFDQLMDRELPDADRERIKAVVLAHGDVKGIHDLRTRWSGPDRFIQFHLELDPDLSLREAHRIADEVEAAVAAAFPGADVIAHQEPVGEFIENDLVRT